MTPQWLRTRRALRADLKAALAKVAGLERQVRQQERELDAYDEANEALGTLLVQQAEYGRAWHAKWVAATSDARCKTVALCVKTTSDAEKWANHSCDQGEPYTVHENHQARPWDLRDAQTVRTQDAPRESA